MSSTTPTKASLAVMLLVFAAATGFLGVITSSMIPPSPSADLFDLSQRLKEASSSATSQAEVRALDQAAANLAAARRAIKHEGEKSWRLRSYHRARTLLWKAERHLVVAGSGSPPSGANPVVPAG